MVAGVVEPADHAPPRLLGRLQVEARAGVVEERVVGLGERQQLVVEPRGVERRLGRGHGRVHARVEPAVDAEHGGAVALQARRRSGTARRTARPPPAAAPRAASRRQIMPPPKQKPIAASVALRGTRLSSSVSAGLHVGVEARRVDAEICRQRRGDLGLARERAGAALLGEQVERQRGVAAGGEAAGDVADVRRSGRGSRGSRARRRAAWRPAPRPPAAARCGPANVIDSRATGAQWTSWPPDVRARARRRRGRGRARRPPPLAPRPPPRASPSPPRRPRPSRPRRRIASRRVMIPSA